MSKSMIIMHNFVYVKQHLVMSAQILTYNLLVPQATRQVARAIEWYGPDRPKWLGKHSAGSLEGFNASR